MTTQRIGTGLLCGLTIGAILLNTMAYPLSCFACDAPSQRASIGEGMAHAIGLTYKQVAHYRYSDFAHLCSENYQQFWKNAPGVYAACKHKDNSVKERRLSPQARRQVQQIRDLTGKWASIAVDTCEAHNGGGTFYGPFAGECEARIEELIGTLLPVFQAPSQRSAKARARVRKVVDDLKTALPRFKTASPIRQASYKECLRAFQRQSRRQIGLLTSLPDRAAAPVANYMERQILTWMRSELLSKR